MSNQNESYPTRRTPAEREIANSLAILRCDMTTVMKDSQPMALVHAVAPVSMEMNVAGSSTMASDAKSVNKTKTYRLLWEHLWDPKFKSKHLAEIQANNGKSRWNMAVNFNQLPNTKLTENLVAYLERNFVGAGLRKSDVRDFVYTNVTSRKHAANKSQAKKKSDNARNRRSSREKEHLKRCKTAYQSNKTAIDDEMKRDCSGLIIEEAMSVGESDDGTSPHVSYSGLRLRRPDWRSDEYNHFITLVDNKVVADLGLNSHQLLSCAFGETIEGPVPDAIASQFPQWALRNGP
ncbi:hypothetical protein PHYBLDRAFT_153364 [Phycomyces blakesleeanus NRRL 1555(-)]|uniref:Homeodomain-like DNA binding domain-containing transcription factor n=1 Tax=Phycomyces blakesleeanus (strain ATCC 8743b / DSM 1359 / FGSC 10004 / NBRC 33097 / NRRL 1555) TaxID=763407 RepID=A0A162PGG1_PHYB8|nr:hypothetical protein PHYBLDRAFT_153364 [Phycomyces blakesleeanus NRRL 1555(-)]OAD65466.1 hypothetical protein PHYBLDRAFT_153364 [Phycomyces blakesleeanus NRRL 1555(-)]|eukprot:XP_018283506.1 hypothetical protein PHYBLDRAFT_153364 [Phycomyces blakesleeanus NRRL 1555(-)]